MTEQQPFWQKPAEERAAIWQTRYTIAVIVATVGWTIVLVLFFCSLPV